MQFPRDQRAMAEFHASQAAGKSLSRLESLSTVHIRQKGGVLSANNKYVVMSPDGAELLYAKEDSGLLNHMFGGKDRAFKINIYDGQNTEVVRLRRPYTFGPDKMDVTVYGKLVSVVRQEMTFFKPVLNINDANDQPLLRVKGPVSTTGEADFRLFNTQKQPMGVISKRWGGAAREMFTDKDNYEIHFPPGASVNIKAAIIGTCFLIDFLYYEN
ncbi:hypothetical protein MSG28_010583 [Choristoneura fumiferana]|uniref:Uncharacterized protein n=1 Tax=Choristoneura fumiferana TaxID=7141 RepID=A0ACC0KP18_CHOFU|nr:hypothetical protein MSG28_010583 [Choristoneura fumiferana]